MKNEISYIKPWIMRIDARNNEDGRVFYTTDVHGNFDLLDEHLKNSDFDTSKDILIVGGDIADRGQGSRYVLDYIGEPWVYNIKGNHEQLLIDAYENEMRGWESECLYENGGAWFFNMMAANPRDAKMVYEIFRDLPLAIELITNTEKVGIVHAEVPYNDWDVFTSVSLTNKMLGTSQWARTKYEYKCEKVVKGVDRVLVGHTPTDSGEIEQLGNVWFCDAGSFFRNKLVFLQLK